MVGYYGYMNAIGIYHMTACLADEMEAIPFQFPYYITNFFITHCPNFAANVVKI
jgi:hypothetical protein